MAITEPYEIDGVTVGATPVSIVSGNTTPQSVTDNGWVNFYIDPGSLAKGDSYDWTVHEKCLSGSTQRVLGKGSFSHANGGNIIHPGYLMLHGWDIRLAKISGTDRALDAVIRAVLGSGVTEYDSVSGLTVGSTELSLLSGTSTLQEDTNAGFYQLVIDTIAAGLGVSDYFEIRIYEKVESAGGTKKNVFYGVIGGPQFRMFASQIILLRNGWDITMKKLSGSDCSFDASIRRVA